jgi:hypothetical protein
VGEYTVRMRHPNAAKHYKVAGPEGVNINSRSYSHCLPLFGRHRYARP